ncbi:hypothetical protein ERJ75_000656100 [Trypanosoma vivax]|nr:hypothetical protein ERJ75_000656100 [Trypanosoma vivax]
MREQKAGQAVRKGKHEHWQQRQAVLLAGKGGAWQVGAEVGSGRNSFLETEDRTGEESTKRAQQFKEMKGRRRDRGSRETLSKVERRRRKKQVMTGTEQTTLGEETRGSGQGVRNHAKREETESEGTKRDAVLGCVRGSGTGTGPGLNKRRKQGDEGNRPGSRD